MNFKLGQQISIGAWILQVLLTYKAWMGGSDLDDVYFTWHHPIVNVGLTFIFLGALLGVAFYQKYKKHLYWISLT